MGRPVLVGAAVKQLGAACVPGSEVTQSAAAVVLVPVTVTSDTTPASILTKSLPGDSSYVAFATPYVQVTGGQLNQQVNVSCTLGVGPATSATQTRSVSIQLGSTTVRNQAASIPLAVTAPSSTSAITASLSCTRTVLGTGTAPTVQRVGVVQRAADAVEQLNAER